MADKMSDAELRKELCAYGEKSIGPITDATRSLYVKKLNKLRCQKKSLTTVNNVPKGTVHKKLLGFSSDESEEEEHKEAPVTKRQTRNSSRNNSSTVVDARKVASASKVTTFVRPVLKSRYSANNFGAVSTVVSNGGEKSFSAISGKSGTSLRNRNINQTSSSVSSRSRNVDHDPFSDGLDDQTLLSLCKENRHMKSEFSDSDQEDEGLDFTQASLNDMSLSSEEPEMISHSVNTSATLDKSQLWNTSSRNTSGYLLNTNNRVLRSAQKPVPMLSPERYYDQTGVMGTDGFKAKECASSYKVPHYISTFLVIFAILFFAFIAFLYINMHQSSENESLGGQNNFLTCGDQSADNQDCFEKEEVNDAVGIIKHMSGHLSKRAGQVECGQIAGGKVIELEVFQKEFPEKNFDMVLKLIQVNPHWKIRLFDRSGEVTPELAEVHGLDSQSPDMDIICRLLRAVTHVLNTFVALCLVAFVATVIISFVRHRWRKQKEEQKQVYNLVEQIIGILKEHHEQCLEDPDMVDYMAIPHVRDMLIPLKERKTKQNIWDKAVKFLSANESRIRVETQKVQGEEFAVWRWLQSGAGSRGEKVWQGQAFELNMPNFTPLPCLKIRNMFNPEIETAEKQWNVKIQDAILEKCGADHDIVHIAVDKLSKEGCVYVKCNSKEAAGRCFSALHGWWFDGKLVTVKFLRLKRYTDRFPESVSCVVPLQPSDNRRQSLSQPFHKSFLEEY